MLRTIAGVQQVQTQVLSIIVSELQDGGTGYVVETYSADELVAKYPTNLTKVDVEAFMRPERGIPEGITWPISTRTPADSVTPDEVFPENAASSPFEVKYFNPPAPPAS